LVQGRFTQDRVVRSAIELHHDPLRRHRDLTGGLHELAVQVLRLRFVEPLESAGQPAVTAVADHRERDIEIDVQADFAGQTIEMEKIHADAQAILDAVASRVTDHQIARCDVGVVGEK